LVSILNDASDGVAGTVTGITVGDERQIFPGSGLNELTQIHRCVPGRAKITVLFSGYTVNVVCRFVVVSTSITS
jgi:hypothetical protein